MITSVHIENFKCFKDFDIELGPFNVLIGLNDSGKTAFMHAIMIGTSPHVQTNWQLEGIARELGMTIGRVDFWRSKMDSPITIRIKATQKWGTNRSEWPYQEVASSDGKIFASRILGVEEAPPGWEKRMPGGAKWREAWFDKAIGSANYYAFDPKDLRKFSVPSEEMFEMTRTGERFPTFLDDIVKQDRKAFLALESDFYQRFPYYSEIVIGKERVGASVGYVLKFHTVHNEVLPADSISDGVMLSLAYIALSHRPDPPKVLLVEEPETGVHHASLEDIVATLRDLSEKKHIQVVITTHSPYLLDHVDPEDVRVFHEDSDGAVHAARLSDHPEVADMKKHFMTGEIWTGLKEADILAKPGGTK